MKIKFKLILVLLIIAFTQCDNFNTKKATILNTKSPDYIKDIVAYKEGSEGLIIYFILADIDGAMTTSDGELIVSIVEEDGSGQYIIAYGPLYQIKSDVKKENFIKTNVGTGSFQHEVILCSLGRIPYSEFIRKIKYSVGKINIEFKLNNGKVLKGDTTIFF